MRTTPLFPPAAQLPNGKLSDAEQKIYGLISRYYLMQFSADAIHREGRLTVRVSEHRFRATETAILTPGWKALELKLRDSRKEADKPPLPRLDKGEPVFCEDSRISERKTKPPQHFNDATLLSAMTNIARFVTDSELRKTLTGNRRPRHRSNPCEHYRHPVQTGLSIPRQQAHPGHRQR